MSHFKRILYCVSLATTVTASGLLLVDKGGPELLIPGFFLEAWLAMFVFIDPEEILFTSHAWAGNIVAYSLVIYGVSWLITGIRVAYSEARSNHDPTPR